MELNESKISNLVENKESCCGCSACVNICPVSAITMKLDNQGFMYPFVDEKICINCNKCKLVCDFKNRNDGTNSVSVKKVYGYISSNPDVLAKSTSGGAFTAISDLVLKNKGVVIGAIEDEKLCVSHIVAENAEERDKMRGSKYVQSDIGDIFKKVKDNLSVGKYVLFTGTPCQVAGLLHYLGKEANTEKLITCDIICHGVVSPLVLEMYHQYIENKTKKQIKQHLFRYKPAGWDHVECIVFDDGTIDYTTAYSQIYKKIFDSCIAHRPACYNCKYTNLERVGDITLGDFWGVQDCLADFYSSSGVSLLLVNSEKGLRVISQMRNSGNIVETDLHSAAKKQPHLHIPAKKNANYDKFWDLIFKNAFSKAVKRYIYNPEFEETKRRIKKVIKKD